MSVDWSQWTFYFNVFLAVANVGWGIFLFFSRKHQARIEQLKETKKEFRSAVNEEREARQELESRVGTVENELRHAPTQGDIQKLSEDLHAVNSTLQELSGKFGGVQRAVDLINTHLLRGPEGT